MRQPLTSEEAAVVALATVREGCAHRRWPPQVVLAFARAEVFRVRAEPCNSSFGVTLSEFLRSGVTRTLQWGCRRVAVSAEKSG